MTKSYSNLYRLLFVCSVFLLSNFHSFSAFSQCNPAANDTNFNSNDLLGQGYGFDGEVKKIVKLNNGKTFVLGDFTTYNTIPIKKLIRLNSDNTIDSSFDLDNQLINDNIQGITLQSDGKILIDGYFELGVNPAKYLLRLNQDGTIDTSFYEDSIWGMLLPSVSVFPYSIAIQSNGKILVCGKRIVPLGYQILRLHQDGSLDSSFTVTRMGIASSQSRTVNQIEV